MMRVVGLVLSIGLLWTGVVQAGLFREDFSDSAAAAAKLETMFISDEGNSSMTFDGDLTAQVDFMALIRTNGANQFADDGRSAVVYQVDEDMSASSGLQRTALAARMDSTLFGNCYALYHYNDGATGSLKLSRYNSDVETVLFDSGPLAAALNDSPVTMSIMLENAAESVDWTIAYGAFSQSGSDMGAGRLTSGTGTGLTYYSAGGIANSCSFDNLIVTAVPEPVTLVLVGLGGLVPLLRRRG